MFKQPDYFEEGKSEINNKHLIIFCTIIALITIGIVVFTGILAFKVVKNGNGGSDDMVSGANTIGIRQAEREYANEEEGQPSESPEVQEQPEKQSEEQPEETPEVSPSPQVMSKFPKHDINAAMESQLPQYSDEIAKKVVNVYFEKTKKVYLTFDDGPSARTPEILDILKKYNVKATFFVLGSNVEARPELVKRAYEEGHFIAIHGYTHKYSQVYSSPQAVLDEYNQTLEAVRKAIGVPNYNPHLFRFPGGSSGGPYDNVKRQAIELLKQNGITHTNWNCLSGDAAGSTTVEAMWNELNQTAEGDDNLVVLMHDAGDKKVTVEFVPQLIEKYQSEGYEFCNYYDVMCE